MSEIQRATPEVVRRIEERWAGLLPRVEAKNKERDALARAMEEFLAKGGKVQEVEANVVADPPKKPDNKYGSRPI